MAMAFCRAGMVTFILTQTVCSKSDLFEARRFYQYWIAYLPHIIYPHITYHISVLYQRININISYSYHVISFSVFQHDADWPDWLDIGCVRFQFLYHVFGSVLILTAVAACIKSIESSQILLKCLMVTATSETVGYGLDPNDALEGSQLYCSKVGNGSLRTWDLNP